MQRNYRWRHYYLGSTQLDEMALLGLFWRDSYDAQISFTIPVRKQCQRAIRITVKHMIGWYSHGYFQAVSIEHVLHKVLSNWSFWSRAPFSPMWPAACCPWFLRPHSPGFSLIYVCKKIQFVLVYLCQCLERISRWLLWSQSQSTRSCLLRCFTLTFMSPWLV